MPLGFKDSLAYDAQYVFGNADEFAEELTLYTPSTATLTANQLLSLMGYPPLPDGDIDAADRRQLLGLYRFGDVGEGTEEFNGRFDQTNLDLLQGLALDDATGRRVTDFALVRCLNSLAVTMDSTPELNSYVLRSGDRWSCLREMSRNHSIKWIAVRRDVKVTTKSARPRP